MSREDALLEAIRELAPDKEKAIRARADQIAVVGVDKKPKPSLRGIWADLQLDVSEQEIKEARREMWKNFPRDFPEDIN